MFGERIWTCLHGDHTLTSCCSKWPLTPRHDLHLKEIGRSVEYFRVLPRETGPWTLEPSLFSHTHKHIPKLQPPLPHSLLRRHGSVNLQEKLLFVRETWNTYLCCICIKTRCFCKKISAKLFVCVCGFLPLFLSRLHIHSRDYLWEKKKSELSPPRAIFHLRTWKKKKSYRKM